MKTAITLKHWDCRVVEIDEGEHPELARRQTERAAPEYEELYRTLVERYVQTPGPRKGFRWLVLERVEAVKAESTKKAMFKRVRGSGYKLATATRKSDEVGYVSVSLCLREAKAEPRGAKAVKGQPQ